MDYENRIKRYLNVGIPSLNWSQESVQRLCTVARDQYIHDWKRFTHHDFAKPPGIYAALTGVLKEWVPFLKSFDFKDPQDCKDRFSHFIGSVLGYLEFGILFQPERVRFLSDTSSDQKKESLLELLPEVRENLVDLMQNLSRVNITEQEYPFVSIRYLGDTLFKFIQENSTKLDRAHLRTFVVNFRQRLLGERT